LKKDVVTSDGARVGRVADLIVEEWRVTGLIVQLSKEAAQAAGIRKLLGKPKVLVPTGHVGGVRDVVLLSLKLEELGSVMEPVD